MALFICRTMGAILLEVPVDLSTNTCILVIRNFINRRLWGFEATTARISSEQIMKENVSMKYLIVIILRTILPWKELSGYSMLTRWSKWCERSNPLQVGDLIFACNVNLQRKQWCRRLCRGSIPCTRRHYQESWRTQTWMYEIHNIWKPLHKYSVNMFDKIANIY